MQMPQASWGGFPGAGAPVRWPLLVGKARALELICAAREIDSAEMNQLGLVQGVHPKASLKDAVAKIAQTIVNNGPLAVRGAKRIMATRQEPGTCAARTVRCPASCPRVASGRQRRHGCTQGKQKAPFRRPLITARR